MMAKQRTRGSGGWKRSINPWGQGKKGILALMTALTVTAAAPIAVLVPANQVHAAEEVRLSVTDWPMMIDGVAALVPAANVEGNTYIGLRALNERLGLGTGWDPEKRAVTVSGKGRTLTFKLDDPYTYSLYGQEIHGLPAIVQDGSTYLPLRFLLERMGYDISYDAPTRTIHISTIEENRLSIQTETISEEGERQSLLVNYPQITGFADKVIQDKINAFLKMEAESQAAGGRLMLASAVGYLDEMEADIETPPVSFDGRYTITYNEQGRLSLFVDYYSYTGGAHGLTSRVPYTFDLTTGRVLSLQEAAEGHAQYVSIINEAIHKQIKERELFLLQPFETIEPDRAFFLTHNGIVVFFSQYEYTAYAEGMPQFEIPFGAFRS
ncbi:PdaC/SigV domain-containing protein [Paenibacillus puerhi]|uniref:PdaC/SigV domain-containing protein n=1 Tax=Paenibacillus puerhi TaxID=2692622 RepID=UPI001358F3F3|nr:DUF4163 domain-containing protein [Paenibacillus puerhi]